MADDLFPEDPNTPSPKDANSNDPPPAGAPPDGPPASYVHASTKPGLGCEIDHDILDKMLARVDT